MALTLTSQCMLYINGAHIDTSRLTLREDMATSVTPFVNEIGESSGTFDGVKQNTLEFECPAAPEYPTWANVSEAVVQLQPRRVGCPKYLYRRCRTTSFESGVQNDRGETVDRVSLIMLSGGRIA